MTLKANVLAWAALRLKLQWYREVSVAPARGWHTDL